MTRTEAKTSSRRGRGTAPLYALAAPLALIVATATPGEARATGLPTPLVSPLAAPGATVPDPLPMTALVKAIGTTNRIDGLTVEELDDGTTVLHLKGSTKPTFNVYRLGEPDRLVVDLASAERGKVVPFAPLDTWACGRVSIDSVVERDAELVRVVVELKREASYVVVPRDGTLVVTITPRQIAPEAYFARKTAGKRQLELQAKERQVAAAERTAKALGIEAKLINTKAKKREEAASKLASQARKRAAAAKKVELAAAEAEKRALRAEKKAGETLADAKSHRFRARRALKQAQSEREEAEKARAEAQAERKAADAARDTANAELRLAKAALDEERDKLIVARQRAEKAEARALVAKGEAEVEKKEATKAKLRARKAEAAAKTAQASAEKSLATARADLARAKAAASRAEADAKSKLAKAERAAAAAEKASSSADKAAAKKLAAAAEEANKELDKARAKVETAETKAAAKLAAAEKAEREAQILLANARTTAKLEAAKVLQDADAKRAAAKKVLEDAGKQRARVAKEAKAEAARLLADAGTKKSRAAALEKKAKLALSRAETAVAEAEAERKAAATARKEATEALAAAKAKAAAADASGRAKAQREVEEAKSAQKLARARYEQTEDAVGKLRKDRDALKTKLAAQRKLSSDLEAKIKTRKSQLEKLELKVANAKLAAQKASSEAKAAEQATAAEVAKAAKLAKATAAAKAKAKAQPETKAKPTAPPKPSPKLVAAEKALAQARVTAKVLEKEVGRLRTAANAAELRAQQAENKVAALVESGAAQAELTQARTAAKKAKTEAGNAAALLAKRKRKLGTVEKTLSDKRTAVARLQAKHDALTKKNEAAAKELTATQSRLAALSKKNAAVARELTATRNKHAAMSKKTEAATRELNAAQAELEQLRASLSAERSELRALSEDVEKARASLDVRMAEAAEAEAIKKRALTEAEELKRNNELARDQAAKFALAKKGKGVRVKDIRFEHDAKEQRVIVSVDGPMRFEGQSLTPTIKMLALDDAKLASNLERSLDASSYSGNIKTITSFAEGGATKVLVSTHGPSKARVEERAGELVWHFPTGPKRRKAASDEPEVVSMAGSKVAGYATGPSPARPIAAVPTTRMAAMAPPANPGSGSRIPGTSGGASQANVQPVTRRRTRWRGERIDIELQDAPIKDVLLLFADIGRVNIIAGNGVDGQVTMKLKAVPWDQALDTILRSLELGSTREGNVVRVATIDDLEAERKAAIDRANARVQLKPIETRIVPVSYATVDEMIPKVQNVLSPRGSVTPDTRTNQLVIMDVADNIAVAELLINSLDTQTPQVLIEARIVEARTSFTRNLGVQWGFDFTASPGTGNPTGLLFPNSLGVGGGATGQPPDVRGLILPGAAANPNYAVDLPAPVGTGQGGALGFSFGSISGNLNTNLRLSAAESTGEVRIISAPKVVTLDNNEAQIETGVQIPISQVSAQGVNTRFVNATLSLRVTPQVTNEGAVLLDVQVQKNEADFVNTGARGDPTILTNQAQSRLLVNDADTAVIGGIYTRNKAVNFTKIPWLADIPIIGWFFKNKSEADTRSEILIFLTPKIVNRASSIGG